MSDRPKWMLSEEFFRELSALGVPGRQLEEMFRKAGVAAQIDKLERFAAGSCGYIPSMYIKDEIAALRKELGE